MRSLRIQTWREPAELASVRIAPDFAAVARSAVLPGVMRGCLATGAVVIAALEGQELCGYATVVPSSALALSERWHGLPGLCELGAIEVARSARRQRVGSALLDALETALPLDALIVMARGSFDSWDFYATSLAPHGYRRMLLGMLARIGFAPRRTDDPFVEQSWYNFLAVRMGDAASGAFLEFEERLELARGGVRDGRVPGSV